MAEFSDLDQFLDSGLTLTVSGRTYVVPQPSAALGLWCQRMAQTAQAIHTATTAEEIQRALARAEKTPKPGSDDLSLPQMLLGDVYDQMDADGVSHPRIEHCTATVYAWIVNGEEAARAYWESGGRLGEAGRPANRADRRAAGKTATAEAAEIPSPVSGSGTSTRHRSSSRRRGSRSRGGRS